MTAIEPAHELAAGIDRQFETFEFHRVFCVGFEF